MELAGKVLIAMPGMEDPRFAHSVVLICAHGPDSAMGLIINKPSEELDFQNLLKHLGIAPTVSARPISVRFGGPVERGRGFVLHSPDWQGAEASVMELPGGLRLTATLDILEALARGGGPEQALLALGYAGWGAGQLESEILRNDWLIADAGPDLIFDPADGAKWARAMRMNGIDPLTLSPVAGRA
ncbi:YqgE/AlgH family protein [Pseudogemmobacter bohemicus]|uniref:YqgE/AlgH family protein n=1 Tax=Pseudogemmobacter bohemicus TaxID=2250708 RepID=UPI000DD2EB01|nr:YqgE/AlgH family protein [Pseudogemmobacter bohemicus]